MIQTKMLVTVVVEAKEFELNLGVKWRDCAAVEFCSGVQEKRKAKTFFRSLPELLIKV